MAKATKKWRFDHVVKTLEGEEIPQHFFASSVATWKVDNDPLKLIDYMKSEGYNFTLWLVPLDAKAPYKIVYYTPDVEGVKLLGQYYNEEK